MLFYRWIYDITRVGFFAVAIFAVVTFQSAIPDEMYVTAGEAAQLRIRGAGQRGVKGRGAGGVRQFCRDI